jgi:hypothetical protein
VTGRFTSRSTSGPLDSVKTCCPVGHRFHGPLEFLAMPAEPGSQQAAAPTHRAIP